MRFFELNGHRTGTEVFAQRMTYPLIRHQDAGQVGVAFEDEAEHVVGLTLVEVGAGVDRDDRRNLDVVDRHGNPQTQAQAMLHGEEVEHELEPRALPPVVVGDGEVGEHLEPGVSGRLRNVVNPILGDDEDVLTGRQPPLNVLELLCQGPQHRLFGKGAGAHRPFWLFGCVHDLVVGHQRASSPLMILSCSVRIPCISDCGPGGQPGT